MRKPELAQLGCADMPTGRERCEADVVTLTSHTTEELGWDPAAWPPRLPWAAFISIPSASSFLPHSPFTCIHPELISVFFYYF